MLPKNQTKRLVGRWIQVVAVPETPRREPRQRQRSNLARSELPFFFGVMFLSDKKSDMFPGTQKKTPSNSGTTICLDNYVSCMKLWD